jgi:hypothetical protein
VRRNAPAPAAGSTSGIGKTRGLLAFLGALVLAITVSLGAASAIADTPPVVTVDPAPTAEYTTAHVSGTVNPSGGPSTTYWHFEYTTTPGDDASWQFGPGGEIAGPAAEGTSPLPVEGTIEFLQPQTQYSVRLVAENGDGANRVVSSTPYPTFTTKGPVAKPTVTLDPVTTFTATTAHFSGTINPGATSSDPGFNVSYHFECTPSCGQPGGGIAADNANHTVSADVKGLEPNTDYVVTLVASNAGGSESDGPQSFHTTAVGPTGETMPAFAIQGGTEAILGGRINPKNSATTYRIEYGTTTAYGNTVPAGGSASAGSGGSYEIFSQRIGGLSPSTVYHFRVVFENASGQVIGRDENFETAPAGSASEPTCPNATLRTENNSTALPECRAYEKVSPDDKNGFDAGANGAVQQSNYVASTQGSALVFESFGAFADTKAASLLNQYLSRRGPGGWETHGLTPAQFPAVNAGFPLVQWLSPDLHYGQVSGGTQGHLAPGDNPAMPNYYRLDTLSDTYVTLNLGGHPDKSEGFKPGGASDDGTRMFFETSDPLTPDAVDGFNSSGGRYRNLYEWHDGQVRLVSIRLNSAGEEEPSPQGAAFPPNTYPTQNQVSADGSRAVFQDGESKDLFLREDGMRTVQVSASQRAVPDPGAASLPVDFAGASADGSKVFFQTRRNLTEDATGEGDKLYLYDVETETLTNLLAGVLPGEEQRVEGLVAMAAISEDGEYAYFRSNSRFHAGDNQGPGVGIYVWHDGTVKFIASDEGSLDERVGAPQEGGSSAQASYSTYRLSPDGRKLSFVSNGRLTSYDNTDAVPAADGSPRMDAEVYIYDGIADRLTCVSCNPTGQRPTGAPNGGPAAHSTFPKPPSQIVQSRQPGVRDDGSIFFNSRDALVPQDVNGKMDVYQWKGHRVRLISSGTDGGDSFLASSSDDGTDVFFQTRERLLASDRDDNEDIYDARVGGGFPKAPEASLCEGIEGCHGPASGSPPFENPASGSFSSPLKQRSPNAQRLRKALKACKHKKKKRARARCRAAAKKRYGKASKGRTH